MADMSVASNNERRLAVSDRPPFAARDDVRFERKPPDRNILDRDRMVDGLKQWGVVLVFVGVVICFSVLLPDTFLTTRNAINILNNSPALILFATGATLALILGEFDLSFPAVADLVAVSVGVLVTSFTWSSGASLCAAMAIGLGCGALVGTINGLFIAKAFVPSFVTTLAVGSIAAGSELAIQTWITGGAKQISQIVLPPQVQWLGAVTIPDLSIKWTVVVAFGISGLLWLLLRRTVPGRQAYAIGGNPVAAYLAGVPVARLRIITFALIGAISAMVGIMTLTERGYFNSASPPMLLQAYSAAFLGAAVFSKKRRFDVLGSIFSVFFLLVLSNGLSLLNQPRWIGSVISGAILLIAVLTNMPKDRKV
jgi:ribose/xylose/arabinose/galactoside ABC-type transport system permease subunit